MKLSTTKKKGLSHNLCGAELVKKPILRCIEKHLSLRTYHYSKPRLSRHKNRKRKMNIDGNKKKVCFRLTEGEWKRILQ